MQLTVSPEKDDPRLVEMLRVRWTALEKKYDARVPVTFDNVLFAYGAECFPMTACACLPGHGDTQEWRIEVNTDWFSTLSAERQELTLLHEWIHLRFMSGDLGQRYLDGASDQIHSEEALRLWNFIHEVAAEYYLVQAFPELRPSRAGYLVDMALQVNDWHQHPGHRVWQAFYQLLRLDLAEAVNGQPLGPNVARYRRCMDQRIAEAAAVLDLKDAADYRKRMLNVSIAPFQYDSTSFDEVRDRIQRLP